jgi:hypothetical protein
MLSGYAAFPGNVTALGSAASTVDEIITLNARIDAAALQKFCLSIVVADMELPRVAKKGAKHWRVIGSRAMHDIAYQLYRYWLQNIKMHEEDLGCILRISIEAGGMLA